MQPRTIFNISFGLIGIAFIYWICAFKIIDSDFWWHIKAGELMWNMKSMITIEPFAYTREGAAYLAKHEWLAQIVLYLIHYLGGASGIIILRILSVILLFGIILSIDRKNIWPNVLLALGAAIVMRQGFIERPQLFTNLFFAFVLVQGLRMLETSDRKKFILPLIISQVLWVNMHGGAAFMTFVILGSIFWQDIFEKRETKQWSFLLLVSLGLLVAMLVSPNTYHNFTYVWSLFTDKTAEFIREWEARPLDIYLSQLGIFWIIGVASLLVTRHKWIATGLLLVVTGYLSRSASRHEVLFLITALSCTFYQLKHNEWWQDQLERWSAKIWIPVSSGVIIFLLVTINKPYAAFLQTNNYNGFGSFEPIAAAFDFVEDNDIQGEMFNNYGAGGYLSYRGVPERKIFVDGRNVDHGYEFLKKSLDARYDVNDFRDIADRYGFTYAIIEYESTKEPGSPFDFSFLNADSQWKLVFVDSWTSVYVQNNEVNRSLIELNEYKILTPENLDRGTILDRVNESTIEQIEIELKRAVSQDERGISSHIALAKLYRSVGLFDRANALLDEAIRRYPNRYEPYEIKASILAATNQPLKAAELYEKVIDLTRFQSIQPNFSAIADLYEQAGDLKQAEKYKKKIR